MERMLKMVRAMMRGLRVRMRALRSDPGAGSLVNVPVRYGINLVAGGSRASGVVWRYRPGARPARPVRRRSTPPARVEPRDSTGTGPASAPRLRLGEQLIAAGLIDRGQLEEALMRQRISGRRLGEILVERRIITELDLAEALARQLRVPFLDLSNYIIDPAIAKLVPEHIAQRHGLIPIRMVGNVLTVAMVDPLNVLALDDIQLMTGLQTRAVIGTPTHLQRALADTYGAQSQLDRVFGDLEEEIARVTEDHADSDVFGELGENDAPVIQLVNLILTQAIVSGCSGIQIEPYERELRVRYRRDGVLHAEMTPPKRAQEAIIQRIKVLASLETVRTKHPRTGLIRFLANNRAFQLGVSIQPTQHGELVTLDVHDDRGRSLDTLGLEPGARQLLMERASRRSGLILLAGPQRSGRSTTFYALAQHLTAVGLHILMIEDRPRLMLHGITQSICGSGAAGGYARALKSVRHVRPDVLMLGDIPGRAAAARVAEALDAGILVIAKLDVPDATAAIQRARVLSRGHRSLAAHLALVCAQRLVRVLCTDCRKEWLPPRHLLDELGATPEFLARAGIMELDPRKPRFRLSEGCDRCGRDGYRGQTGIFEVMALSDRNRRALESDRPAADIARVAIEEGAMSFAEAALRKVLEGVTSLVEVHRLDRLPGLRMPGAFDEPPQVEAAPPPAPAFTGPQANLSLVLWQDGRIAWRRPLKAGSNTIGVRDDLGGARPHADLTEHDRIGLIAPLHAQVIVDTDQLWVLDELGSTGTQLNGRLLSKAQRTAAKPGDTVTLGGLTLAIEAEGMQREGTN